MLLGWLVYQERKDLPQDLARQLKAAFTSLPEIVYSLVV